MQALKLCVVDNPGQFIYTFFPFFQDSNDVTITDERDPDDISQSGSIHGSGGERGIDVGRVGAWATDFEKLLRDPLGLQTFTVRKLKKKKCSPSHFPPI